MMMNNAAIINNNKNESQFSAKFPDLINEDEQMNNEQMINKAM